MLQYSRYKQNSKSLEHINRFFSGIFGVESFVSDLGGSAGMAVAYVGRHLNVPVTIVVPKTTSKEAVQRIQDESATVVVYGEVCFFCCEFELT